MEKFVVSAIKYRPTEFEDVVGQEAITSTLEAAIQNNTLAQALLFYGPRGVGKTTCARILARKINEATAEDPNADFSFNILELDAASNNSVDDIRNLIDQVKFAPQNGKYKVYIIDEVHMLSTSAFNAFLKTLEEPPEHAIFILATTEKHKIIPTILSRCQIYDFKRITVEDITNHLIKIANDKGLPYEEAALHLIAQKADGALRDALSMFDRLATVADGKKLDTALVAQTFNILDYDYYFDMAENAYAGNISNLLLKLNDIVQLGFDLHLFIAGLGEHFRDLLVAKNNETVVLLETSRDIKEKYLQQASNFDSSFILNTLEICNQADVKYKGAKNQRLLVEVSLMQIGSLRTSEEALKKKVAIL